LEDKSAQSRGFIYLLKNLFTGKRGGLSMYVPENKKQLLDSFIHNIACLSDKKYQERIWVRSEGPEFDDIDDTVCDFFDDGNPILEKYAEYGITEIQYKSVALLYSKLRKFTDTFQVYSRLKSTEQLIELPQWQEIREESKNVLKLFDKS